MDTGNEMPWASIFDPAANVRALTAIQAEGLSAASKLVDRFVQMTANGVLGGGAIAPESPLTAEQRADLLGATDVEPLIRSWWSTVSQAVLGYPPVGSAPVAVPSGPAAVDFDSATATGRLELAAAAGGTAAAEVWLHNRGSDDRGQIRLRGSDLTSDTGAALSSAALTCDPSLVPMPGRCSRGVTVRVAVPADAGAGTYRGTLLTEGHPDLWLAVVLTVWTPAA